LFPGGRTLALANLAHQAAVAALGGPEWLRRRRLDALERFRAAPLPTEAEEVWRYSRIDSLDLDAYRLAGPGGPEPGGWPPPLAGALEAAGPPAGWALSRGAGPVEARLEGPVPGLVLGGASSGGRAEEVAREHLGALDRAPDCLVELNSALVGDVAVVEVAPGVRVGRPVVVLDWVPAGGQASFPRTLVRLAEGSSACVLEVVASKEGPLFCAPVVELEVAEGAHLDYLCVQLLSAQAFQVAYQASQVGAGGSLVSFNLALGGDYARVRTDSVLSGAQAASRLLAAYFGDGTQMHDFRTLQDHAAPRTTSDLLFKGAVKDCAHSVYSGMIRVHKGARGTNAFQTNRNLVIHEGARADSVPNLEIEENDVRCSHASAVGPIAADQRFYLESRGVPPEMADRLITLGFLDEVLARTPVPALVDHLRLELVRQLDAAEAHEAAGVAR
jgi:Fe-S cluster assembly protein SufD